MTSALGGGGARGGSNADNGAYKLPQCASIKVEKGVKNV